MVRLQGLSLPTHRSDSRPTESAGVLWTRCAAENHSVRVAPRYRGRGWFPRRSVCLACGQRPPLRPRGVRHKRPAGRLPGRARRRSPRRAGGGRDPTGVARRHRRRNGQPGRRRSRRGWLARGRMHRARTDGPAHRPCPQGRLLVHGRHPRPRRARFRSRPRRQRHSQDARRLAHSGRGKKRRGGTADRSRAGATDGVRRHDPRRHRHQYRPRPLQNPGGPPVAARRNRRGGPRRRARAARGHSRRRRGRAAEGKLAVPHRGRFRPRAAVWRGAGSRRRARRAGRRGVVQRCRPAGGGLPRNHRVGARRHRPSPHRRRIHRRGRTRNRPGRCAQLSPRRRAIAACSPRRSLRFSRRRRNPSGLFHGMEQPGGGRPGWPGRPGGYGLAGGANFRRGSSANSRMPATNRAMDVACATSNANQAWRSSPRRYSNRNRTGGYSTR